MSKLIERPKWYPLKIYKESLTPTPERWLYEIWKRNLFNLEYMVPSASFYAIPIDEKIEAFESCIFSDDLENFLSHLRPQQTLPIKHLSVSDAFRIVGLVRKSEWYQNQADKGIFESAINTLTIGEELSEEQKKIFKKYFNLPWHIFHEKTRDKTWYPTTKDIPGLSGIPISIVPSYVKESIINQLKGLLKLWVGRKEDIALQFDSWQECNILSVFDLRTWFAINDIPYKRIDIHKLIWPEGRFSKKNGDSAVNAYDDIDYIMPLTDKVINPSVVRSLIIGCEGKKYQKKLMHR